MVIVVVGMFHLFHVAFNVILYSVAVGTSRHSVASESPPL